MLNIFVTHSGWTGDCLAKPESWDQTDAPKLDKQMKAYFSKVNGRYILEEYQFYNN